MMKVKYGLLKTEIILQEIKKVKKFGIVMINIKNYQEKVLNLNIINLKDGHLVELIVIKTIKYKEFLLILKHLIRNAMKVFHILIDYKIIWLSLQEIHYLK